MIRKLIIFAFAVATALTSFAGKLAAHHGDVAGAYNYWLYTPDESAESEFEPKPVVVFLHGQSLCGRDLNRVKRYGTIDAIEKGRDIDAYVVAPQNPGGAWNPDKIMKIVDAVGEEHNIDYDRIYVIGMSLGGYGAIDLAATYPDQIAAAMAFCGGGSVRDLSGLSDVPLWIVHGTADAAVNVSQSDKVVSAIRATGDDSRLHYDRVPGMNHSRPARFFYLKESYDWLFNHSLKDHKRPMAKTFDITNGTLHTAYSDLRSTGRRASSVAAKSSKSSKKSRHSASGRKRAKRN